MHLYSSHFNCMILPLQVTYVSSVVRSHGEVEVQVCFGSQTRGGGGGGGGGAFVCVCVRVGGGGVVVCGVCVCGVRACERVGVCEGGGEWCVCVCVCVCVRVCVV